MMADAIKAQAILFVGIAESDGLSLDKILLRLPSGLAVRGSRRSLRLMRGSFISRSKRVK
jgi:hypothetical protein